MASGFGLNGGRNRCFPFWQEVQKCYITSDKSVECKPFLDDYLECLHHTKEISRAKAIKAEENRQLSHRKKLEADAAKRGEKVPTEVLQPNLIDKANQPGAATEAK
ncbi:hypothetical protein CONCODRAFT_19024 [Conidiobolus coronatus NRRL 28638]|uniref:NADH dehydrogenase [ubiquinone] iron-sulfur protein 5 n=1 Tax=Conidiobolus coronatus (strain ATCC 28846 / CBS 209.66 / NRRL 28638) TaxID=796925 RepID=A0A137P058_CONC2|nr:hypothetical protein CONCODRAFT_19024 [Conidiobolus coronatus NRRL 28638]|eukprot:KXN68372.1 hypothetical protein CONCODRAFT_19024 [Conidiobolus coronatus NRRL 28638]